MKYTKILAISFLALLMAALLPMLDSSAVDPGDAVVLERRTDVLIKLQLPEVEVSFREMEGRAWTYVDFEGAIHPPADGGPALPYLSHPLQVEREIENIWIERKDPITAFVNLPVAPGPEFLPLTEEVFDSGSTGIDLDWKMYTSGRTFPSEEVVWAHTGYGWSTGERLAHYSVSISPFNYEPTTGKLTYYRDITLMIEEKEPDEVATAIAITRDVVRPSLVEEGTELLIITHDPFINDLDGYVQWKREKGLIVSIVKYSLISSYGGKSGHQAIWQFIHDTYFGDDRTLEYVLLAGEPKYVPTLMAHDQDPYGSEPSTLPADTYFACLDGTSTIWNGDGDTRWGETVDIGDAIPEVYVSRISLDTDTEALNWAKKVVDYETKPDMGGYSKKVALFGSTTHEYDDGPKQCEYLYSSYLTGVFNTPAKYYSYGAVQQSVGAQRLTYNNAKSAVNSGVSMIVYMGHGYHQMWSEGTQSNPSLVFYSSDAAAFTQSPKLPLISAMSCETNWFDNGNWDSISEAFMENANGGAIGYIGASRTTEGGIGYYEYLPGAPGIQEDTLRMMKNGITHQAEIFHEAKSYYYDQWGGWFNSYQFAYNAWLEHNILGSPETEIWSNTIKTFDVDVDFEEDYYSNFTINVKDSTGKAVKDAVVTVYSEDLDLSSKGITDAYGNVDVPFMLLEPTYAKVTVTSRNFKPFQKSYYVEDKTDPVTTIDYQVGSPDGANSWYRSDPGISFHASEPGEINYRWNGGSAFEFSSGNIQIPKGDNLLEYWTEDLSRNKEDIKSVSVKYDPDTPVLEYSMTPEEPDGQSGWFKTLPVITTSILGDEASPHHVEYWWGSEDKQISNGTIYAIQGDNDLHMRAVDSAGNIDDEVEISMMVDSISPLTEINTGGEVVNEFGWYTNYLLIELTCPDRTAETYYRWNSNDEWIQYRNEIEPPMGNNTLEFYSKDSHGNHEPIQSFRIPYDTKVPKVVTDIDPRDPDGLLGWYTSVPRVSLSTEDNNPDDRIYYYIDSGLQEIYKDTLIIPEGEHTLYAFSIDEAGNRGITQVFDFKVDTDAPETEHSMDTSPDEDGWITEVPMIILRSSDDEATIFFSWTGNNDYQVYDGSIVPEEDEGDLTLFYYSMDEAGNEEDVKIFNIYLDARAPEPVVIVPPTADQGDVVTFDMTRSSDLNGVVEYYVDFGDGTNSGWVTTSTITHAYGSGGTFEATIKVKDAAGHESEGEIVVIEITKSGISNTTIYMLIIGVTVLFIGLMVIVFALIVSKRRAYVRHHPNAHQFHFPHPHLHHSHPSHQGAPHRQVGPASHQQAKGLPVRKPPARQLPSAPAPVRNNAPSAPPKASAQPPVKPAAPPAPPRMPEVPKAPVPPS